MITIDNLKEYGYNSIVEYYLYIFESNKNGNKKQVLELYNELSEVQKEGFIDYCSNNENRFIPHFLTEVLFILLRGLK